MQLFWNFKDMHEAALSAMSGLARFSRAELHIIVLDGEVEIVKHVNPKSFNTEISKGHFQQILIICCKSEKWFIVFPECVENVLRKWFKEKDDYRGRDTGS